MTETKETPVKKVRRGINNETRSTSQLKFHEKDAIATGPAAGLFLGHLEEVKVDWRTIGDDSKGLQSFAGKSIPRLVFEYTSNHESSERRHYTHVLLPVESNIDTIPNGQLEWQVNNVFAWIKHVLEVFYLKGREMTEAEADALTLSFVDFDDEGTYVPVEADEVIRGYQILFENAAAMLNGTWAPEGVEATGKKCYKAPNGGILPIYMKLSRFTKRKNEWKSNTSNGDLAFATFVGEGAIEICKGTNPPSRLRYDAAHESITPKETRKAPTVGVPGAGVVPGMGVMPSVGAEASSAFTQAADDMPF